ncbi:hypothetical protein AGMMS4952_18910 [Spirochaetia bacterium]|nr:hypothetical protein AGMMS4952_18910 [Spirochaetia bacterium]
MNILCSPCHGENRFAGTFKTFLQNVYNHPMLNAILTGIATLMLAGAAGIVFFIIFKSDGEKRGYFLLLHMAIILLKVWKYTKNRQNPGVFDDFRP